MRQDNGLQVDNQVFVRRKNEVVGELNLAVEIVTATFGVELHDIEKQNGHPSINGMKSICEQLLEAGL